MHWPTANVGVALGPVSALCGLDIDGDSGLLLLDRLTALADKSMVTVDATGDAGATPRFRLLETVRQYAVRKAAEAGETSTVAGRHLAWAVDFARRLEIDVERAAPECLCSPALALLSLCIQLFGTYAAFSGFVPRTLLAVDTLAR